MAHSNAPPSPWVKTTNLTVRPIRPAPHVPGSEMGVVQIAIFRSSLYSSTVRSGLVKPSMTQEAASPEKPSFGETQFLTIASLRISASPFPLHVQIVPYYHLDAAAQQLQATR